MIELSVTFGTHDAGWLPRAVRLRSRRARFVLPPVASDGAALRAVNPGFVLLRGHVETLARGIAGVFELHHGEQLTPSPP
ncbi:MULTISPECIES: hypothetical protein [unclassified Arthrobacter]|uniref:hypothetical protein n=1 Tax=unclassified Arthrobacter TaxID=235627 RepID=UPI0028831F9D|nr:MULTISPECIES: hypothetical protein [unclassified Arthrobacter]